MVENWKHLSRNILEARARIEALFDTKILGNDNYFDLSPEYQKILFLDYRHIRNGLRFIDEHLIVCNSCNEQYKEFLKEGKLIALENTSSHNPFNNERERVEYIQGMVDRAMGRSSKFGESAYNLHVDNCKSCTADFERKLQYEMDHRKI